MLLRPGVDVSLAFCPTGKGGGVDPTCSPDHVATGPDGEDIAVPEAVLAAKTGEPVTLELFRGTGDTTGQVNRIPAQYARGQHWAPTPEHAASYGPDVESQTVTLDNPYVWDIPGKQPYFVELNKEFGTRAPDQVTNKLLTAGHDALIVRNVPVQRKDFGGTSAEIILLTPEGLTLAFCATGEGGGVDPTCSPGGDRKSAVLQKLEQAVGEVKVKGNFGEPGELDVWMNTSDDHWAKTAEYEFKTKSGRKFDIRAELDKETLRMTVVFQDDQGSTEVTGKGEQFQVFRKVVPAVAAIVADQMPETVSFTAREKSRIELYRRLVVTLQELDVNYYATEKNYGMDGVIFNLRRN